MSGTQQAECRAHQHNPGRGNGNTDPTPTGMPDRDADRGTQHADGQRDLEDHQVRPNRIEDGHGEVDARIGRAERAEERTVERGLHTQREQAQQPDRHQRRGEPAGQQPPECEPERRRRDHREQAVQQRQQHRMPPRGLPRGDGQHGHRTGHIAEHGPQHRRRQGREATRCGVAWRGGQQVYRAPAPLPVRRPRADTGRERGQRQNRRLDVRTAVGPQRDRRQVPRDGRYQPQQRDDRQQRHGCVAAQLDPQQPRHERACASTAA